MLERDEALAVLTTVGYGITSRTLTNWTSDAHHVIPRLCRADGGDGHGRGPAYGWDDEDALLQLLTVCNAMADRARIGEAKLRAWWAGFDYDLEEMRSLWVTWTERETDLLQRGLVEGIFDAHRDRDTIDMIAKEQRERRVQGRNVPDYRETFFRMTLDPLFDATTLDEEVIRGLARDLDALNDGHGPGPGTFLQQLADDAIRALVAFLHEYYSPATLPDLLRAAAAVDLQAAHDDWRLLAGIYRWWLRETVLDVVRGTDDHAIALRYLPVFATRVGRAFILADLALRQHGCKEELERSLARLRALAAEPTLGAGASSFRRAINETLAVREPMEGALLAEQQRRYRQLAEAHPEVPAAFEMVAAAVGDLWHAWAPVVQATVERSIAGDGRAVG